MGVGRQEAGDAVHMYLFIDGDNCSALNGQLPHMLCCHARSHLGFINRMPPRSHLDRERPGEALAVSLSVLRKGSSLALLSTIRMAAE